MSKALTQIIYLSSAVKLMSNDELQQLLNHSRQSNQAKGISGMLIYDDGNFIQVLEGTDIKPLRSTKPLASAIKKHPHK